MFSTFTHMTLPTVRHLLNGFIFIPFVFVSATFLADNNELVNGVISAKYFWFFASMALMVPAMPFLKSESKISVSDLMVIFCCMCIWITALVSGVPYAKNKLLLLLLLFILYFQLKNLLVTFRSAEFVLTLLLITSSLIECFIGLGQLYGFIPSNHGIFKITGTFFNPGPYSGFVGMIFPLSLQRTIHFIKIESRLRFLILRLLSDSGRFFKFKSKIWLEYLLGLISMITVITTLLVLPAAMSRASWLGLIAGSLWVLMQQNQVRDSVKRLLNSKSKKLLAVIVLTGFLIGSGVGLYILKPESANGRILLWKSALRAMNEHPLGVGIGKFGSAVGGTQAFYFESGNATQSEIDRADVPFFAFNEYLQMGVESGLFSLALFFAMLFLTLRNTFLRKRHGHFGALISFSIFAFFSYPLSVLPLAIALVFLLAMSNTSPSTSSKAQHHQLTVVLFPYCSVSTSKLFKVLCMALIIACFVDRFPTYNAWKKWGMCKLLIGTGLSYEASVDLKALYPYLSDNPEYLFDYARSLSMAGYHAESNRILVQTLAFIGDPMIYCIYGKNFQALKNYDEAEINFRKAYNIAPNRLYPLFLLSKLYVLKGETFKAREVANKIQTHKIIVPSLAIEQMKDSLDLMFLNKKMN